MYVLKFGSDLLREAARGPIGTPAAIGLSYGHSPKDCQRLQEATRELAQQLFDRFESLKGRTP